MMRRIAKGGRKVGKGAAEELVRGENVVQCFGVEHRFAPGLQLGCCMA
jgi:hypothetical protein